MCKALSVKLNAFCSIHWTWQNMTVSNHRKIRLKLFFSLCLPRCFRFEWLNIRYYLFWDVVSVYRCNVTHRHFHVSSVCLPRCFRYERLENSMSLILKCSHCVSLWYSSQTFSCFCLHHIPSMPRLWAPEMWRHFHNICIQRVNTGLKARLEEVGLGVRKYGKHWV